jgi:hypothetical protein
MSDDLITDVEHREALRMLSAELAKRGYGMMALGSSAVLLKSGAIGSTKDVDVHPFHIEDVEKYWTVLDEIATALKGHYKFEKDGASVTLQITVRGRMVPVEFIEGREDFIEPHVLADALKSAKVVEGVYVPTWEHLVGMKTEAYFDRTGEKKTKYLADLGVIRERIEAAGEKLGAAELERVIRLRPEKKHQEMLQTAFRELSAVIAG